MKVDPPPGLSLGTERILSPSSFLLSGFPVALAVFFSFYQQVQPCSIFLFSQSLLLLRLSHVDPVDFSLSRSPISLQSSFIIQSLCPCQFFLFPPLFLVSASIPQLDLGFSHKKNGISSTRPVSCHAIAPPPRHPPFPALISMFPNQSRPDFLQKKTRPSIRAKTLLLFSNMPLPDRPRTASFFP